MADPVAAGGVAGALAAVSAPLTKLVETVSAGLGRVYEPTHQRRMAKAEGDRMIILANAANTVTDIQRRAADRWLAVETIRQQNMEAIADKAQSELPPTVDAGAVSQGWTAKFFDLCKDVSDDEMQAIWARLLAGEVAAPGTHSLRTMHVLANLSSAEAQLFDKLCSFTIGGQFQCPFMLPHFKDFFEKRGLGFDSQRQLVQAGLVHREDISWRGHTGLLILAPLADGPLLVGLHANPSTPTGFEMGNVSLTQAGSEIARLWKGMLDPEHAASLVAHFKAQGWQMEALTRERLPDGTLGGAPMPKFVSDYVATQAVGGPPPV